jgi:dUTP pyrophosphatase
MQKNEGKEEGDLQPPTPTLCHSPPVRLCVKLLDQRATAPAQQTKDSIGYDLTACTDTNVVVPAWSRAKVSTGLAVSFDPGFCGEIRPRSGLSSIGIDVALGTIDPDYRGELRVIVINSTSSEFVVRPGDRIAQLVVVRCTTPAVTFVREMKPTVRGDAGFGSTGGHAALLLRRDDPVSCDDPAE